MKVVSNVPGERNEPPSLLGNMHLPMPLKDTATDS